MAVTMKNRVSRPLRAARGTGQRHRPATGTGTFPLIPSSPPSFQVFLIIKHKPGFPFKAEPREQGSRERRTR